MEYVKIIYSCHRSICDDHIILVTYPTLNIKYVDIIYPINMTVHWNTGSHMLITFLYYYHKYVCMIILLFS